MDGDTTHHESSLGPVIGTIIILAIILLGGLYFWSVRAQKAGTPVNQVSTTTAATTTDIQAIQSQSSSDDAAAIQADLNATNVDTVDANL